MTKKDWLSRGWYLDKEIAALEETKRTLFDRATNMVQSLSADVVQSSGDKRSSELYAVYSAELDEMVSRVVAVKMEIQRVINTLPDSDSILRTILNKRYVQCMKWEAIAVDIGYSYRDTTRKHGEALMKIHIPGIK